MRLHWTDKPYRWHVNDGAEVFVGLDGAMVMRWREDGDEHRVRLEVGDLFVAETGEEHVASLIGEAGVLSSRRRGRTDDRKPYDGSRALRIDDEPPARGRVGWPPGSRHSMRESACGGWSATPPTIPAGRSRV